MNNSKLISIDQFEPKVPGLYAYMICNRIFNEPLHHHDFFQVCFVKEGKMKLNYNSKTIQLYANEALILPPWFSHEIIFEPDSVVYSLYFTEEFVSNRLQSMEIKNLIYALQLEQSKSFNTVNLKLKIKFDNNQSINFIQLIEILINNDYDGQDFDNSIYPFIISACLQLIKQAYLLNPFGQDKWDSLQDYMKTMGRIVDYIESNYSDEITIGMLTRKFALSKSILTLIFPKFTGKTLLRYVNDTRIKVAIELLHAKQYNITQVSQMVGYSEFSTFYRNFKKVTGVSPSNYQRPY